MDWFARLTGFRETTYHATKQQLVVEGHRLHSLVNGRSYGIGALELVSLQALRERVARGAWRGTVKLGIAEGDVRLLHRAPQYEGALFQVASQFNLLEMVGPGVTPEAGVTRYQDDRTQGPACAIAAGAATIYRNYFVPVGDQIGQTSDRQLDALADVGSALAGAIGARRESLWTMRNGYAMCSRHGLDRIAVHLQSLEDSETDDLRAQLRIGVHRDVEVTDGAGDGTRLATVSQAFCSALPVAYDRSISPSHWKAFASLVLEGAYEATLLEGVHRAQNGKSNVVLLTRLGGGAFGNDDDWIDQAMRRAFARVSKFDLDVKVVSFGGPSLNVLALLCHRTFKCGH